MSRQNLSVLISGRLLSEHNFINMSTRDIKSEYIHQFTLFCPRESQDQAIANITKSPNMFISITVENCQAVIC